jgi:hypothetical protein
MIGMSATMGYLTALIGAEPLFVFGVVAVLSAVMVFLGWSRQKASLVLFAMGLTYLTHFLWALHNPITGNSIMLITDGPVYNLYFLLLYAVIFALGWLLRSGDGEENGFVGTAMFVNLAGCYGLYLLLSVARFRDGLAGEHGLRLLCSLESLLASG